MSDTVAFVQEWMMSSDHEPTQWDRDFAAAIDARCASSTGEGLTSGEQWPERAIRIAEALEHEVMTERDESLWCRLCNTDCGADGRGHARTCVLFNEVDRQS
jgi:hypothetical protein